MRSVVDQYDSLKNIAIRMERIAMARSLLNEVASLAPSVYHEAHDIGAKLQQESIQLSQLRLELEQDLVTTDALASQKGLTKKRGE